MFSLTTILSNANFGRAHQALGCDWLANEASEDENLKTGKGTYWGNARTSPEPALGIPSVETPSIKTLSITRPESFAPQGSIPQETQPMVAVSFRDMTMPRLTHLPVQFKLTQLKRSVRFR